MLTSLYGPFYVPAWPVLPSRYTRTSKFRSSSWTLVVFGPFRLLRAVITCRFALIFWSSVIAFLIAAACYVTIGASELYLVIQGYALYTSSIGIRLSRLAVSLIALKAIYNAISWLISGISAMIIIYIC